MDDSGIFFFNQPLSMMYMPLEENWINEEECMGSVGFRDRKRGKDRKQVILKIITLSMQRNFGIYTVVTRDCFQLQQMYVNSNSKT